MVALPEAPRRDDAVPARPPSARGLWPGRLLAAALAAAVASLAYDSGSYGLTSRGSLGIVLWWVIAVAAALGLGVLVRPRAAAAVALGLLAGLALLSLASVTWSAAPEHAVTEFNRVTLYLAVLFLAALVASRSTATRWADGFALGITAVAVLALASRLLPEVAPTSDAFRFLPSGRTRLGFPLGYWNGLAELLGIGAPLLLRAAVAAPAALTRGLAVAPLPAFAGAIYLTSSRGGVLVAIVGVYAFLVLVPRWTALAAVAVGALGGTLVVWALVDRSELVNGPLGTELAERQGRSAALVIALACVGAGLAYGLGARLLARLRPPPRSAAATIAALGVAGLVAVASLDPVGRFRAFRSVPGALSDDYIRGHLLSGSGNGRWQLWTAAVDQFRANPFLGGGAGSFHAWWERDREIPLFVRDAHSLYAELLGELGPAGFLLVTGLVVAGLATGVARTRAGGEGDAETAAALTAAFSGFAVAAAVDWVWELTVVTVVGIALLGLVTGRATAPGAARPHAAARGASWLRAAVATGALALAVAQALPVLGEVQLRASQEAAAGGDAAAAVRLAEAARRLEPWSSPPLLQLAILEEDAGRLAPARRWIDEAIDRNPDDWRLRLIAARIETKAGSIAAARRHLAEVRRLNPLWRQALALASPP